MAKFGPKRIAAFGALWRALVHSRRPGTPGLAERFHALPRMAGRVLSGKYPALSRGRLALLVLAIAYLVSPVDLVPELLLGPIGLADDGVVALWLAGAVLVETERFLEWERTTPMVIDAP